MAVNKPTGDNARKGAVKKRSQTRTTLGGASAWTKRNRTSGEFMALKRPGKKKAAKKFKGVRVERRGKGTANKRNCREEEIGSRSRALDIGAQKGRTCFPQRAGYQKSIMFSGRR